MATERDYSQLLAITFSTPMPYEWSIGKHGSLFFHEIKQNQRFVGIRCSGCGKVYVPPRRLCGICFKELDEFVTLPNKGTIVAFSIVNYPFIDPDTGHPRPIPYTFGQIRIDGSHTMFSHVINETDVAKIEVGMKVMAVFKDRKDMQGNIRDIKHFKIID